MLPLDKTMKRSALGFFLPYFLILFHCNFLCAAELIASFMPSSYFVSGGGGSAAWGIVHYSEVAIV